MIPRNAAAHLVAGQGMDRNCNGENRDCSRDNEKGHLAYLTPHAQPIEADVQGSRKIHSG